MAEITGGELLLKCLKEEGIEVIFGVLDGSYNPWLAKLNAYDIKYIAPRHEAAAAHMAEAWTRIKGKPAVVVGGIGPGSANMISGVITAFAEGSPIIVISGQRRRSIIYPDRGGSFQNVDQLGLFRPVTKFCAGLRDWRRMPELVRRAFREALNGRPGPVYIEIPEDVMRGTGDPESAPVWPADKSKATHPLQGNLSLVKDAVELLAQSKRPFVHAGSGVTWSQAWAEFLEIADHLSAGISTTLAARGVVPEDHPRYIHPLDRATLEMARSDADVVLVVGARLGELDGWGRGASWGDPTVQKVIQIDSDPASIGLNRPVDIGIVGDARATLKPLTTGLKAACEAFGEHPGFDKYRVSQAAYQGQVENSLNLGAEAMINPGKMIKAAREFFPRDAIMVMDGGNTSLWSTTYNPIYAPRSFLYTAKFGHLGTGLPYAIGAKIAEPDRPVYLITGDGALGFNIQEFETAARHNANIVVIVSCDLGWGMERSSQLYAQVGSMIECDLYAESRYDQVAQAFGWHGELVSSPDQMKPALERAVGSSKPALLQVMVDPMANMAAPGLMEFGNLVYRATD